MVQALARWFAASLCLLCLTGAAMSAEDEFASNPVALSAAAVRELVRDPGAETAGHEGGMITIVEFFDYRCPFCRAMQPTLHRLIMQDSRVRLVLKEWPVLGGDSVMAARIAIAAGWQGRYPAVHDALLGLKGELTEARVKDAAAAAGVDLARLDQDLTKHRDQVDHVLARSVAEAQELHVHGTPTFVIGRLIVPGAVTFEDLRDLVAAEGSHP